MTGERLKKIKGIKDQLKAKQKGKKFGTLSAKDKDQLLEALAKIHGLIEDGDSGDSGKGKTTK